MLHGGVHRWFWKNESRDDRVVDDHNPHLADPHDARCLSSDGHRDDS